MQFLLQGAFAQSASIEPEHRHNAQLPSWDVHLHGTSDTTALQHNAGWGSERDDAQLVIYIGLLGYTNALATIVSNVIMYSPSAVVFGEASQTG